MEKVFTGNGIEYTVETITAIASCDEQIEASRQPALLVATELNGEKCEHVVFGWEMPADDAEFADMCADSSAWDSDWETLETVQR